LSAAYAGGKDPTRFKGFLDENISPGSKMPLSYNVYPSTYFDDVPDSKKNHDYNNATYVASCNKKWIEPKAMEKYEFQTETYLTNLGLNIYDGAIWCIAKSLLGGADEAMAYITNVLGADKTFQFGDIRGDAACKGDMYTGGCKDPEQAGACGFCYGDDLVSLGKENAFFFRMIGDYYGLQGTIDQRCPDLGHEWTWNDYKPILGENAWAQLLGPLTTAYIQAGRSYSGVSGTALKLANSITVALRAMRVGDLGAFYYSPHNAYFYHNMNAGATVSTENQASLLAGMKAYAQVLNAQEKHTEWCEVQGNIADIKRYLLSAWDSKERYFRQGGTYDRKTKKFTWAQGDSPKFAVDCQTWVGTVLGPQMVDDNFGAGASIQLWQEVKKRAGYRKQASGFVKGVGYTDNSISGEVLSGEWTLGAINWLRVLAAHKGYNTSVRQALQNEADYMRAAIDSELLMDAPTQNGTTHTQMKYASDRYYIPFGWWANPIGAIASTAWAVAVDSNFNPLMLNGAYSSEYDDLLAPMSCPPPPGPLTPPPATPVPPGGPCLPCTAGAVCCNPSVVGQKCPGDVDCCDCGASSCTCRSPTPAPPAPPTPSPAPGTPTPAPACAACSGVGSVCCAPGQMCPGNTPCCDCGAASCLCSSGPPPAPAPPPSPGQCKKCSSTSASCCSAGQLCISGHACCNCGAASCECN